MTTDPFKSPGLIFNINKEISKSHVGNDKGKLLTFFTGISGRLNPDYRISIALRGISSVGKTNLIKSTMKYIPPEWYAYGTRFTRATLEDDIKKFNTIVSLEKPLENDVVEAIKQLAEDGTIPWKKDKITNQLMQIEAARKAVIYSSVLKETKEELATRFLVNTVYEDKRRYARVINDYKNKCVDIDKAIESRKKKDLDSWITKGLRKLKVFDFIQIPYAQLLNFNINDARVQRDMKRFYNLIRIIAWVNQKLRYSCMYKGYSVLLAYPEDFHWAEFLSREAFLESMTGINKDLEKILKELNKLTDHPKYGEYETVNNKLYINRNIIQKNLNIKAPSTIRERCNELEKIGHIQQHQAKKYTDCFVHLLYEYEKHPLLQLGCNSACNKPVNSLKLYCMLRDNMEEMYYSLITGKLQADYSLDYSLKTAIYIDSSSSSSSKAIGKYKDITRNMKFEDIIVYLNGKLQAKTTGYQEQPNNNIKKPSALKPGEE